MVGLSNHSCWVETLRFCVDLRQLRSLQINPMPDQEPLGSNPKMRIAVAARQL